ncbi:fibronectin type III domain-containing protein [Cellulomonas sp. HZM]|uniref:fibronectin type III domain-containing protein n=1 Tax=Cellulomonas sp. HZM TaxID=1454010 RepID=UPI00068F8886|nr:fibronectin type III domain-containing protein [Cellulomonas sp. HZM]
MSWPALRHRVTTAAAVVTVPVLVLVLAVVNQGFPLAKVDLNDGAVWVTATDQLRLGRYNVPVEELNAGVAAKGESFDVEQDGGDVLLVQQDGFGVVDPATVSIGTQVAAAGADVSMAAGVVAVVDADGGLYVRAIGALDGLAVGQDPADVELGTGGKAVVAQDGTVLAVHGDGTVTRVRPGEAPADLGSLGTGVDAVTAVGDEVVGLSGSRVVTLHGHADVDGDGPVLQQAGPSSSRALVATTDALVEVPLGGGTPKVHRTTGSGVPAAPVQVGDCAHAAWATATGSYLRLCDGQQPKVLDLEDTSPRDVLKFRVNRSKVVLNDTQRGRLWMPLQDTNLRTPDWDDIDTPDDPKDQDKDTDSQETTQNLATECSKEQAPPVAVDDDFGVRAGRTTVLPVIDNDSSADCGVLVVSDVDKIDPAFGVVEKIYGGRELQVRVAPGATRSVDFTYTITDGRGTNAPSTAHVRLTVHGDGDDSPPEQVRTGSLKVGQDERATYQALSDFRDPDGDDLLLVGAHVDRDYGEARFRQDGSLTFVANGSKLGRTTVRLLVSDGTTTVEGKLDVDVRASGSLPPQIDPVYEVAYVNNPITVHPLDAVRTTSSEPASLASVGDVPGATVTADLQAGTFTFQAARATTYYVPFVVTAAPQQATGLARIDVIPFPKTGEPPVAVRDRAFLPAGGEVTIDPLANDSDPAGGVLVLQQVDAPSGSPLRVAVLDHHLVQIRSIRTLDEPVVLSYTVSNGVASAIGQILVQPVPAQDSSQPPVVENVEAQVRTGGVVTIPVLDTAYDPDGDKLTLLPDLGEPLPAGQGLLFVSGDVLRYQAPSTPVTARATFQVADESGQTTGATVTVRVHASNKDTKAPPRPKNLTARVFAGDTVRIPVPLVGIDVDGDGVTLLGNATAPQSGVITDTGADWIEYRADAGSAGTDTFTYAVEDWVGQRAVGTIQVGISPPAQTSSVVARDDTVTVRPGERVEVRVLANDVDSSGGELTLDPTLVADKGIDARAEGRRIAVTAPAKDGTWQVQYVARNARGGHDTGVLTVVVKKDAPVVAPVARDVVVPPATTLGLTEVGVDVLGVAQNPSGPLSDLEVHVPASAASVARVDPDGRVVVTLVDHAQTVPYYLVNRLAPERRSYAFITVPASGFFPPTLRPNAPALRVASGEALTISLQEYVKVAPGRQPSVADVQQVTASHADGSNLVKDPGTLVFRSAKGYAGAASVTLPVTDSNGSTDTGAHTAFLTLPIEVYAVEDYPPKFTPSVLTMAPGEAAGTVDLTAFTHGPAGASGVAEHYTYQITSAVPAGFTASLDGSNLSFAAAASTPKGRTGSLALRIGYGRTGSMAVTVPLEVIASTRPTARVQDVHVDGQEGTAVTVDVLKGAFNPFPGQALAVVGADVETPDSGTVSATSSTVTVRPAEGFIGAMKTRFRVRDVTGDPDRVVEGRITVTVRGVPDAPASPRVGEVRDRTVVLSWTAPDARGAAIDSYRLTAQPGGKTKVCVTTSCTFDGLTNDTQYTFTVAAHNVVGWSPESGASAPARPDAVPDTPAAPTLVFGDRSIDASWAAPASTGSPVTSYTLELTAPGGAVQTFTEATTHRTFTGLTNGLLYSVRVRAHNAAPDPSGWSRASTATPAGVPDAPVVKVAATDTTIGNVLEVTWTPPAANGDAVDKYEVTIDGPNAPPAQVVTGQRFVFNDAKTGTPYKVSVRAHNKAGWGSSGTTTASTYGTPRAPSGLTATAVVGEGAVDVSWNPWTSADANGSTIDSYVVHGSGGIGDVTVSGSSSSKRFTGLTGGKSYSFTVVAVNAKGDQSAASDARSADVTTHPSTPGDPQISVTERGTFNRPTKVTISWQPSDAGGGSGLSYEYRLSAGSKAVRDTVSGTSVVVDVDGWVDIDGTDVTLTVNALTSVGATTLRSDPTSTTVTLKWGVPPTVSGVAVTPKDSSTDPTSFAVRWDVADGGYSVTYEVRTRVDGGAWTTRSTSGSGTSTTLAAADVVPSGATAGDHTLEVQVRGTNKRGTGDWAGGTATFTTSPVSPPPDDGSGG